MVFGIIAAGEGSRLAAEGITAAKPLVKIGGTPLVDRLLRIFVNEGAEKIAVICNDRMTEVRCHLETIQREGLFGQTIPLDFIVQSTPSSMHSLNVLRPLLGNGDFILTTVDTIFREDEFHRYVAAFRQSVSDGKDGLMGVTDYVDDEKPLWVGTDAEMRVTGYYDVPDDACGVPRPTYVSAGIYGLTSDCWSTLDRCMARGEHRMRNFQRALVNDGRRLEAFAFTKVLDVDHAADIAKAEALIQEGL